MIEFLALVVLTIAVVVLGARLLERLTRPRTERIDWRRDRRQLPSSDPRWTGYGGATPSTSERAVRSDSRASSPRRGS